MKKQTKKKEEKEQKKPIVIKRTKKIRPVRQDTEQQNEDSEDEKPAQAPKPQKKQKQKQKSNPVEIAVDWDEPMQLPPEPDNSDFIHNNAQEYSLYKLIKSLTL